MPPSLLRPAAASISGLWAGLSVFAIAALPRSHEDPFAAGLTMIVAIPVVWYTVGHLLVGGLGRALLERQERQRALADLIIQRPPARAELVTLLVAALVGFALLAAWAWL